MAPPWGATPPAFLSIPHPPTTLAGVARVSIILASRKLSATPYPPSPGDGRVEYHVTWMRPWASPRREMDPGSERSGPSLPLRQPLRPP